MSPFSPMDQPIPIQVYDEVVNARKNFSALLSQGDKKKIRDAVSRVIRSNRVSGLILSQVLFLLKKNYGLEVDTFYHEMFEVFGLSKETVRRYLMVAEFLEQQGVFTRSFPPTTRDQVLAHPMQNLIAIAQYNGEHGGVSRKELQELTQTNDMLELRKKLRRMKGIEETVTPLSFVLRKDGYLEAWEDGKVATLGHLDRETENALHQKALMRLVSRVGVRVE